MAHRFVGLDPTWSHLPAPAPIPAGHCYHSTSSLLFHAAAFEDEALTSALRASMAPANAAASSSYPTTPSSSSTSSASELLSGGHDAPAPASRPGRPPARAALAGPKGGRVTKRNKPRASKRPPTTYITADPANFRRMVQEITGFPVAYTGARQQDFAAPEPSTAAPNWPAPPACMLPTLDTSAFLLDHAAQAPAPGPGSAENSSSGGASPVTAVTSAAAAVEENNMLLDLEAVGCAPAFLSDDFPTLESWGII